METPHQFDASSTKAGKQQTAVAHNRHAIPSLIEACTPREDLLKGTFNPEVFTASLGQVMDHYRGQPGLIDSLYTDAETFFEQATYPSQGFRTIISEVFARLAGDGTSPALHRLEVGPRALHPLGRDRLSSGRCRALW